MRVYLLSTTVWEIIVIILVLFIAGGFIEDHCDNYDEDTMCIGLYDNGELVPLFWSWKRMLLSSTGLFLVGFVIYRFFRRLWEFPTGEE